MAQVNNTSHNHNESAMTANTSPETSTIRIQWVAIEFNLSECKISASNLTRTILVQRDFPASPEYS